MPTALITGASRGVGRAIAVALASDHDIVAIGRSKQHLDALARQITASGGRCRTICLDLRDGDAIAGALAGTEADVLVNNAGVMHKKALVDLAPDEWREMMDVNVSALYHVTRAVLPGMIARRNGHIVNIASITGRTAFAGGSGYSATKHAVLGLSESLMLEVRPFGVRVSVVLPGSVATGMLPAGSVTHWMLRPEDVAQAVKGVLTMPAHALVYQVEVRAANPQK